MTMRHYCVLMRMVIQPWLGSGAAGRPMHRWWHNHAGKECLKMAFICQWCHPVRPLLGNHLRKLECLCKDTCLGIYGGLNCDHRIRKQHSYLSKGGHIAAYFLNRDLLTNNIARGINNHNNMTQLKNYHAKCRKPGNNPHQNPSTYHMVLFLK